MTEHGLRKLREELARLNEADKALMHERVRLRAAIRKAKAAQATKGTA